MIARLLARASLFLCVGVLTALPSTAQIVDADVQLGDTFEGHFLGSDTDAIRFEAVAGTVVQVVGSRVSKKEEIFPVLKVIDVDGDETIAEAESFTGRTVIKKLTLPTTGTYEVQSYPFKPDPGHHRLRVTGRPPKTALKTTTSAEIAAGDSTDVVFTAVAGWELTLRTPRVKSKTASAGVPTLVGPDGAVDLTDVLTPKNGIKKLPLPASGSYTLTVPNAGTDSALFKLATKLKPVRSKETFVERTITRGDTPLATLSGVVREPDDAPLPLAGVTVTVSNDAGMSMTTTTNAFGQYLFVAPPTGPVALTFDGSTVALPRTSASSAFSVFPGRVNVVRDVALVDLDSADNATDSVLVDGSTGETLTAEHATLPLVLSADIGTDVALGGEPFTGTLDVTLAPLVAADLPDLPPQNALVVGAARLFPDDLVLGEETPADLLIPDTFGVDDENTVSLWHLDPTSGAWTDLTALTDTTGSAIDIGDTAIEFVGTVTRGGYLVATVPTSAGCTMTIEGRFPNAVDSFLGPTGMLVTAPNGATAVTDWRGAFTLADIPVHDPSAGVGCVAAVDFVSLTVNPAPGSSGVPIVTDVVGTLDGFLSFTAGGIADDSGHVALLVTRDGAPVDGTVDITSAATSMTTTEDVIDGRVFLTDLDVATYEAAFTFEGDDEATVVAITMFANRVNTARIAPRAGSGFNSMLVRTVFDDTTTPEKRRAEGGVTVRVSGSDDGSSEGITGTTNARGELFLAGIDSPVNITAVLDVDTSEERVRLGTSLTEHYGPNATLPLITASQITPTSVTTATLKGTLTDIPPLPEGSEVVIEVRDAATRGEKYTGFASADLADGTYELAVPSDMDFVVSVLAHDTDLWFAEPGTLLGIAHLGSVSAVGISETATLDGDLSDGGYVPFDESIDFSAPGTDEEFARVLWVALHDEDGQLVTRAAMFASSDGDDAPATLNLADPTHAALADHSLSLSWELSGIDGVTRTCVAPVPSPLAAINLEDPSIPTIASIADGGVVKLKTLSSKPVVVNDPDEQSISLLRAIEITSAGETGIEGVDRVEWTIYPSGVTTSTRLPASPLALLVPDIGYALTTTKQDYSDVGIFFGGFFFEYEFNVDELAETANICTVRRTIDITAK